LATPDLDVEVENNVMETNDFGNLNIQGMVMAKSQHISSDGSRGTFLNTFLAYSK
jgi:hypothetical protein